MKAKIINNVKESIIGYNNYNYKNLKEIDNNSCFEIIIENNVLGLINNNDFELFIQECCSKIRHGGSIIIEGVDFNKIAISYIHRYINEKDLSNILAGSFGFYNCRIVEEELKKNKLNIISMRIFETNFIVEGKRE